MNLQEHKVAFLVATAVLALLVASPALQRLLVYPQTDFFTEMWLLGSGHNVADYPFNITRDKSYSVFLGVANHLGECAYYVVEVKFRNATQSAPDSFNRTASSLKPLCSFNIFVADKESFELPVSFSFDYVNATYNETLQQVRFRSVTLNGVTVSLNGYSTVWDKKENRFYGNLVFELWIYNDAVGALSYHERYTDLKLNMIIDS